jgi:addiction module HigA family antidote
MAELLNEIHPGEILLEDFMKPLGISARQLAADIDVSPSRISDLVHGNRPVTADTALRLGLFFNMEPRFPILDEPANRIRHAHCGSYLERKNCAQDSRFLSSLHCVIKPN